jgi:SAM-dependent methyltransferase
MHTTYLGLALTYGLLQSEAFNPSISCLGRTSCIGRSTALSLSKRSGAMSRKKKKGSSSGGFAKDNKIEKPATIKESPSSVSGSIYSRPALYDLAFGYRNYEDEVDFLLSSHEKYSSGKNINGASVNLLELAAGPARHTITALRNYSSKVASCTAVDLSRDMIEYSKEVADEELGDPGFGGMRDRFEYCLSDMRTLSSNSESPQLGSIDAAWILLGSMQHLTSNDDVISCFSSTSELLREGGTLIIELPHPTETFTMVECTRNGWEVPLEDEDGEEYGELKIIWGDEDDRFDPIRQVRDFTVEMKLTMEDNAKDQVDEADLQSVKEVVPMRLFTYQEIEVMARIAGFEVEASYGALSDEVNINSEDGAFRLVCILRKLRAPISIK